MKTLVLCHSNSGNTVGDLDLIEANNKITAVNFEYFSVLRFWLRNIDIKTYQLQDRKEQPKNKVILYPCLIDFYCAKKRVQT